MFWVDSQSNYQDSQAQFLDITIAYITPYRAQDVECCKLKFATKISGVRLGGWTRYTEYVLQRLGIMPDGCPGKVLLEGIINSFSRPLAKLLKLYTVTDKDDVSSKEGDESEFGMGMPYGVDVSVELRDWIFALEGTEEIGDWACRRTCNRIPREVKFWQAAIRNLHLRGKHSGRTKSNSTEKASQKTEYPFECFTARVEGLQAIRPHLRNPATGNGTAQRHQAGSTLVSSDQGTDIEATMVTSQDGIGVSEWTVDKTRFSVEDLVTGAVLTKEEHEYLSALCKSEADSLGRIAAAVLRLLELDGSHGQAAIDQLASLVPAPEAEVPPWLFPQQPFSTGFHLGGSSGEAGRKFRASNELWRIILEGFKPYNPDKLTRREAVDSQLNNTALHMIQTSVGTQELPRVRNYTTAKEAWDGLAASCIGSESTRRNKYNALRNQAEGFMRLPDEDHQVMYGRLLIVADAFRLSGATHINDSWIKEKYIECMMPFVPIDVKTLVGRECYSSLSSQDAVHEMQALKVLEQNSHDSRNRAIGMAKGNNLALTVNSVEEVHPQEQYRASWSMSYPEDLECHYHDHMAFHAKSFWVDPSKAKEDNIKRNHKSGFTSFGPKTRSCYNCDDKRHFIAECPYENRELHNGRLIPKDKSKESKGKYSKAPNKKFYNNKTKKGKRPPRVVLVTREEYSSDEVESSSDDEGESSKEVAAIVTTNITSSSLFESPNENPHIKNAHCFMATSSLDTSIVLSTQEEYSSGDDDVDDEEDATSNGLVALASLSTNSSSPSESPNEIIHVEEESCLMAKSSEVSSPSPSMPNISSDLGVDDASLKVKQEMLEFEEFMFNLQGINKKHVSNLMARLAQQNDMLEKKGQIEREDSLEIHALKNALEESQETIASLEERLENLEEPQDEINKLTKARDHARAKTKLLKKEMAQFGVDHEKLVKDLDELEKAHKALKSEYSLLSKLNEQLQIRLASYDVPSSSTPSCDHANIIEENARLKDELAKASSPQSKLSLDDLLSKQRSNNGKEGLGYVAKAKKANKQKAKPAQEKKKAITNGEAPKGNTINNDDAGNANPNYDYAAGGSKWVLDSGCTSHMTGGKNLVKELRPNINNITVSFGDNSTSEVMGFGKVVVAHNITLVDVMLVKTLGYNLLSVSALGKMGFAVFIDNDIVVLLWSKTLKVAFVGYREHNLYVVNFSGTTTSSAMCLFEKADVGWLWHRRLAHVNMRTLQSLHKGNHIVGLMENVSFAKDRVCRACVEGKMHDSPHPSKTIISSKRILELLHVDLFGPVTHASLGAKKHCLVIVDDYSRYTWVYFLKTKDETQQIFIDFATEVQRQHNLLIMAIRSDNGSEFKNYTLNDFLSDEGIRHQYSASYTPQQNGVAERENRTLMDMARSMMAEYKSRYNFWAEAISTACHSSNRLYLRKGLNKTPYEILTGNKPNISYFKVFGCKCFYKIKGVHLSKFAPKALEGIFVGYGAESHTYRIFDIASGIIIESCSVRFEENDGSQVGQVDVCAGDEIPQDAIVRMGVGFFRPIEGHGVASREELCSTKVEPSSSQHQQTPSLEANDAPTQEQEENPPSHEQDQGQDQPRIHDGSDEYPFDICASPNIVQDQAHEVEHSQEIEEAQIEGQDGDPNDQVDQVTPPRPKRTKEEIEARRLARRDRILEIRGHTHDKVLGDVRAKLMTDRFEMSMMGEMKFFLGFEIKQLREGTFINQAKYLQDMLKRFKMTELKGVATPMVTKCHLALDPNGPSKKRNKTPVDEIEEEFEQTRPSKLTARQQSSQRQKTPAVRGKNIHVSVKNMQYLEYKEIRDLNPYLTPRNNRVTDKRFHNKTQEEIFYEVYVPFKKG
ncbi:hypothetical protein QYE76_032900 [Lolium multiflorum]|uniref:Integrase catalytic domain-containing protein n=1 Tax=Lolium multiflorum TaxID=4521 RepID=A0AAD8VIT4_LOLMU|nr:hypothetical protein QYE76_032900 [Lolium multiflorum]